MPKNHKNLLSCTKLGIPIELIGDDVTFTSLCHDSKKCEKGALFFVTSKTKDIYIIEALEKGAIALCTFEKKAFDCPQLITQDVSLAMAKIASEFHQNPSKMPFLVGVTGTCGKTTTSHLIHHLFESNNIPFGLIGTNGIIIDQSIPSPLTTPDALFINELLYKMNAHNKKGCVMEVSSHALIQNRTAFLDFDCAVFTNFSHEHLDYHGTMDNYFNAKAKLFYDLKPHATAILNVDDEKIKKLQVPCKKMTFGIENKADLQAQNIQSTLKGSQIDLLYQNKITPIKTHLIGQFNIYNILASLCVGLVKGVSIEKLTEAISTFKTVKGRLERIENVFIDYAHKTKALENVLLTLKPLCSGKLICVFGCGGDRDQEKRAQMGKVASELSDEVIITSDNPRSEDPKAICDQIAKGCTKPNFTILVDRKEAILQSLKRAQKEDVILIAGKGHETYQIQKDKTIEFSDHAIIEQFYVGSVSGAKAQ